MLIALEGIDGSGKATQAERLVTRLNDSIAQWVELFSFPQYDKNTFGSYVKMYLSGRFGGLEDNHPFLTSLLYSLDRFESKGALITARDEGVCVCDRYVASNIAHQCAKIPDGDWQSIACKIVDTEHSILGLPKPDLTIYLDITAEESFRRTHARDDDPDLHQDNIDYMRSVRERYLELARSPGWHVVECADRTVDDIHNEIFDTAYRQWDSEVGTTSGA